MRILYGVAGEGFGHASHALAVADFLEKNGHKVIIITYGQAYEILKDKFHVFLVRGIHPVYEEGVMSLKKSFFYNLKPIMSNVLKVKEFRKMVGEFNPDICISDMEPITVLLSYFYNLPLIFLSNQNRFINFKLDAPKKYFKDYLIAKAAVRAIVPKADYYVALSLSRLKTKKKNIYIVPPIIRNEIRKLKPRNSGRIVVYLSKKNKNIIKILKGVDENFIIYGYDKRKKEKNLEFKTKDSFLKDFKECKAIISTSGFTSVGESLYLKKPYLALPLRGQFEQVFNAIYLKKNGFGDYSDKLTLNELKSFLLNLDKYRKNLKRYKTEPNKVYRILEKIIKKIEKK
jgi:uncharacterized protein (TIGR00661 family)